MSNANADLRGQIERAVGGCWTREERSNRQSVGSTQAQPSKQCIPLDSVPDGLFLYAGTVVLCVDDKYVREHEHSLALKVKNLLQLRNSPRMVGTCDEDAVIRHVFVVPIRTVVVDPADAVQVGPWVRPGGTRRGRIQWHANLSPGLIGLEKHPHVEAFLEKFRERLEASSTLLQRLECTELD